MCVLVIKKFRDIPWSSHLKYLITVFLIIVCNVQSISADEARITVFEPKTTNSYREIFREINQGISSVIDDTNPFIYDINRDDFPLELFETEPIVLSGKLNNRFISAIHFSASSSGDQYAQNRFVSGAVEVPISSTEHYGVTLFYDPRLYIDLITNNFDNVKKIVFFHNPTRRAVTPEVKKSIEGEYSTIEVMYVEAQEIKDAINVVEKEVIKYFDGTIFVFVRGFIEISNSEIVLDYIVKETWAKGIPTVGNRIGFVKSGMAIGLAPNFYEMGVQIGELRKKAEIEDFSNPRVEYLESAYWAINLRTYKRVSGSSKRIEYEKFKYVYRERQ